MFNPLNLITKFIKSSNQKELDRIGKIVKTINSLENEFKKLDDLDFPKKTQEYKEQQIIDEFIRKPAYAQVDDDLVEIKRSNKEAREHYINQIVYTRNPIKNLKFVIVKEKDPRFLKAIMLTDMDNNNKNCDGILNFECIGNVICSFS